MDESSCQTVFKYGIAGKFYFSLMYNVSHILGLVQIERPLLHVVQNYRF
jgi:hypothetical protein